MSRENAEVVRRWFDRLAAGDPAPDLCAPEIEIRNWSESPVPGPYRGHDGLHQWWREVNDPDIGTDIQMFRLEEIIDVDERCFLTIQVARGRARHTRLELEQRWASVICVRNGQIVSATGYATTDEARRAVGLPE